MPQCGSCASSVRAWRLWTARHSWEEVAPLSAPPLLLGLELATSKVADSTAFEHAAPPILTLTVTLTLTPTPKQEGPAMVAVLLSTMQQHPSNKVIEENPNPLPNTLTPQP